MKKFLILIIVLLVVAGGAWAGTTFFFGSVTGAWLTTEMEKLEQQSGTSGVIDFEQSDYKKGFLSSEATTTLRVVNVPIPDFDGITLKHRIYHGPLAKTPDGIKVASNYMVTTIDLESLPEEAREVIAKGFDGKNPFTLNVTSGFGGTMEADMEIPAFTYQGKEGEAAGRMEFAGITGQLSGTGTSGDGKIEIGALKFEDETKDFVFDMDPGSITVDVRSMADEMPIDADAHYRFPKFSFTADGKTFRVSDVEADYEISSKDSKTLDGAYEFTIGSVKLPAGEPFAAYQETVANGARIGFKVSGMEIASVKALIEAQREMQKAQADMLGKGTSQMTPENIQKSEETAMAYIKGAFDMIQEGFGMGMEMSVGSDSNKSEFNLDLNYTAKGKSTDLETMGDAISAFSGGVKLRLDKGLVPEEQAAMLDEPIEQGFVIDKGSHYEAVVKLSNATLDLNGNPMPLLEQLGPQAEEPIPWDTLFQGAAMGMQQ